MEDDGSSGSAGSHWEERWMNTEFMGAVIYSSITYVSSVECSPVFVCFMPYALFANSSLLL